MKTILLTIMAFSLVTTVVLHYYTEGRMWLARHLFSQKLNNPLGFAILFLGAIVVGFLVGTKGIKIGVGLIILFMALPTLLVCVFYPLYGLQIALVTSILVGLISKYFMNVPFGLLLDLLLIIMFLGLLIKQHKMRNMDFAKNMISGFVVVWIFLNLIQVLNPVAGSRMAWMYTVRSMAGLILLYFIACYAFSSRKTIYNTLKFILFLALISALYGLNQEFFGFSKHELIWLYSDKKRLQLIQQWSRLRIFSFFSDPTTFGIFMAYMGTFATILATGPFKNWKRIGLIFAAVAMFAGMAYAGSRTPFVLVPFGFAIFTILSLKRNVIMGMLMLVLLGTAFVMKSTSSAVAYRIQSAFRPEAADDTMGVRKKNRKFIQPYVHRHPMGYGLGSTGIWAARFTPDHFLAGFAHDSGFLRVAVELGWIGLIFQLTFFFVILRTGIYYMVRVRDPKNRTIYMGITVVMFQLTLANYPQEAVTILPTSLVFYCFLAMLVKLKDYDPVAMEEAVAETTTILPPATSNGVEIVEEQAIIRHKN